MIKNKRIVTTCLVLITVLFFLSYFLFIYNGDLGIEKDDNHVYLGDTYVRGDVDEDGSITTRDYLLIKKHILKIKELSEKTKLIGDVNNDGNITSMDCMKIRKILLNQDKTTTVDIPVDTSTIVPLSNYKFSNVTSVTDKRTYKVLIIDIDPILTKGSIQGVNCAGKTASACLKQDKNRAINELITDFEYSSHGYLDIVIEKTESINEFATYKNQVTLLNGTKANKYDENTWLDIMKNGWYSGIYDERVQNIGKWFGTFDYEYIIEKLNLIERRNKEEFDEVWIVNVDPTLAYESIMVGTNAWWINGSPIEKKCEPFKMVNVSISRPDSNYECFGHATERLLNKVFSAVNYDNYNALNWEENSASIDSDNYSKLSLWQKFMLTESQNKIANTGLVGVGNMHYSPNSTKDYDWNNTKEKVYSKWREWENYPNLTSNKSTEVFNPNIYMKEANTLSGTKDTPRLHHRWWFGLLPHHTGYTEDGYTNNWWEYYVSNTYVKKIVPVKKEYTFKVNDKIDGIKFRITNYDDTTAVVSSIKYLGNIKIANTDLFNVDGEGNLYAGKKGTSTLRYYRDGVYATVTIKITN